jgi:hypothetical protein
MRRRDYVVLLGGAAAWPLATDLKPATREIDGLLWSKSGQPGRPVRHGEVSCSFI